MLTAHPSTNVNVTLEDNSRLLRNRLRVTAAIRNKRDSNGEAGIVEKHFVLCIRECMKEVV